jgi:CheY-like chemotaxis protein
MGQILMTDEREAAELQQIHDYDLPELIEHFPSDCFHHEEFLQEGGLWKFNFKCNFMGGKFYASTVHYCPKEAFASAREKILKQLQEWREKRFTVGSDSPDTPMAPFADANNPRILLIDDDQDFVLTTALAFEKAGMHTDVAVRHQQLHQKIINADFDYLIFDWNLNDAVTADLVLEKTIRLIDTFSDLREKFTEHKPRIVTYSATDAQDIHMPPTGSEYFDYIGHWRKPMPFAEIISRAKKWLYT